MARKKRKKKLTKYYLIFLFLIFGICLAGALLVYNKTIHYNDVFDSSDTQTYTITVASGSTGKQIAELLQKEGIIRDSSKFRKRAKILGIDTLFQAGEYQLSPSMSTEEIYEALQHARRETVSFTIPEGYYIRQVAQKLVSDGLIASEEDFYKACEDDYNYDFIPNEAECVSDPTGTVSARANRLEGYLYPETYNVFKDASAHDIIDTMLAQFAKVFSTDYANKAKKLGYSTHEIITIASMIERETMVDSEREKVASVIYNRLNIGMPLQLDASVQYCLGEHTDRVLYEDLEVDSPYNTYKNKGLPIGPISSPGKASIEAALYPAETNYIYYVLKPDKSGEHNFAETSTEFTKYRNQYINSL